MPTWKIALIVLGTSLGLIFWALIILGTWVASEDDLGKAIFAG